MNTYDHISKRFQTETATHAMTILHDDGLYRHLRFAPTKGPSFYWFDLITWPHNLVFRGDGESYAFSRIEDMFAFFRSGIRRDGAIEINPGYWSEKLTSTRDVMTYDEEIFRRRVKEHVAEAILDRRAPRGITREIRYLLEDGDITWEGGARQELDRFEFDGFRFEDAWEWNFRDYDWWFLWACYGICWGIAQYDAQKTTIGAAPAEVVAS